MIGLLKTISATTPRMHMEGFTNGSSCHFLKKYSIR